jgi:predicted metal-dependent HD superfamily phosphohydrolase
MTDIVPLMARPYAKDMFATLLDRLAVSQAARNELTTLLNEPFRRYHTAGHVGILWHRHLAHGGDPDDPVAAHAIAYHDAIYRFGASDNEAQSAELWRRHAAALPVALREQVVVAIMATSRHDADHTDRHAQWLVDLDLTPLGEPWPLFQANSAALHDEAPHVPRADLLAAQRAFLGRLAGLPMLYRSRRHRAVIARAYEATARENLTRLLSAG